MTLRELRASTKQFDEEFVADESRPLTKAERALWEKLCTKPPAEVDGVSQTTISVRLEKALLDRCIALAKKRGINREALIVCALKKFVAGEQD